MTHYRRFISTNPPDEDNSVKLTEDEHYHLKTVLRGHPGFPIEVIDGKGRLFQCEVREVKTSFTTARILSQIQETPQNPQITVGVSILKKRSMQIMIEKLSELGVDVIQPIVFERTDTPYNSSSLTKWEKIALQSLKVNRKLYPTRILPPVNLQVYLDSIPPANRGIFLDIEGDASQLDSLPDGPSYLLIGPPGDYTEKEAELIKKRDFLPLNINSGILKSETAAIAIASILTCRKAAQEKRRS